MLCECVHADLRGGSICWKTHLHICAFALILLLLRTGPIAASHDCQVRPERNIVALHIVPKLEKNCLFKKKHLLFHFGEDISLLEKP